MMSGPAATRCDVENRRGISAPATFACTRKARRRRCRKIRFTQDVVREVGEFFSERLGTLLNEAGIAAEQVVLDPGIGFGKTLEHNLQLLAGLRSFTKLAAPAAARRLAEIVHRENCSGAELNERLPASLACATLAVASGAQIIRTHDVAETVQAVRMAEAILSRKNECVT